MSTQKSLYLVFSNPVAGRDGEFQQWYARHFAEVLGVEGFVSGRRMMATDVEGRPAPDHAHLVAYEIAGEVRDALANLGQAASAGTVSKPDPSIVAMPLKSMIYTVIEDGQPRTVQA